MKQHDKNEINNEISIAADLHTHTVASGHAYATVTEMAREAARIGLSMLGIADHGPAMPGGPHRYYFGNLKDLPPKLFGVEIIRGVEANVLDSWGRLDLPDYILSRLDLVLVGFHVVCYAGGSREENTQALLKAMDNPYVDGIVHPGNPEFEVDFEEVVEKAVARHVLLEVNNKSLRGDTRKDSEANCRRLVKIAQKAGAMLLVSSDAHFFNRVGSFEQSLKLLKEERVGEEQIFNISRERIINYLAGKGKKRFRPQA